MKRQIVFIVCLLTVGILSAQDTIPFLDPCFCYPFAGARQPANSSTGLRNFSYPPEYIHNKYYIEHHVHSKDGSSVPVYGIAITSDSTLPTELTVGLYWEPIYFIGGVVQPIDSLNCSDAFYHKRMFYKYQWSNKSYDSEDTSTHNATAPCHLYFFNQPVYVPDTFFYKTTAIDQPFRLRELSCYRDSNYMTEVANGYGGNSHYYNEGDDHLSGFAFYTWGGIFPILSLPCPPASKPEVVESRQGSVRFSWWEGDTNLYRVAIHTYPDTTLLYLSDTLADSTFHLITDSLAAAISLPEGRYYLRLQRACNYMDSPYDTLLWSPWSEPRMFYYAPAPAGIGEYSLSDSPFSLSPNPASGTVTLSGLPEGSLVELYDLKGRLVKEFKIQNSEFKIDVSALTSGTYLLRITTPAGTTTKKLLLR